MAVGGGETEKDPSALTVDVLNGIVNDRVRAIRDIMDERDLRYEQRFQAQQDALAEKDATTQARLANINEFRAQLGDVLAQSLPRVEAEQRFTAIESALEQRHGNLNDKIDSSIKAHAEAIAAINSRLDLMQGGRKGVDDVRIWVVGAVGVAASIAGIALALTR